MKSILIVAPANDARAALSRHLEENGYRVHLADDLGQARASLLGLVPGVIIIDQPAAGTRRLIRHLTKGGNLQLVPRLVFIDPLQIDDQADAWGAAAAFARPVSPDHLVRALQALYPRGTWNLPAEAAPDSRKHERIKEAIEMVAASAAPPPGPPASLSVRPAAEGRSERAIAVAYAYAIEAIRERISNDNTPAQAAAALLPQVVPAADASVAVGA